MKKSTLYAAFFTACFLLVLLNTGWAQLISSDNFNYSDNSLLTDNGWVAHNGGGTAPIAVGASNGLTYEGYSGLTGITGVIEGNAAKLVNTGEDDSKVFAAPVTTGTIYFSFLTKITTGTAGYYLHLGGSASAFASRIFVKPSATSGKINFGISNTSTAVYAATPTDFDPLTTYLIIVKYDVSTTGTVSMWIMSSGIPSTEIAAGSPEVTTSGTGQASIDRICLRQYSATQSMEVDGIRIGQTWTDIVSTAPADVTPPTFTVTPHNHDIDVAVDVPIILTFDEAIRNIDDSEITDANVAALLTLKETDASGADVAFIATIDADKKVITATPTANFKNSQVYYAAIAPVEDAANNATEASNMTFTTIAASAATISDVAITGTSPYYAGDAVTITWVSANVTNVMIEAWISNKSRWDTIFASIPSDGSETITIPTDAKYAADYKLRISDVSNPDVFAESANFTIIAVVNNLLALRAQPTGAFVKYAGIATVTFSRPTTAGRNQKYIQDATAAVVIDDNTPAPGFITGTYNVGDGITNVVGKISLYSGLIEFTPTAPTGEPATGIEIVPEIRTLESLKSADQCKLVKIENFAFKSPRQFVKSTTYAIDGYDSLSVAYRTIFAESDYIGGQAPVGPISSIALVGQYNAQMQITARSWSDMEIPMSLAVTSPIGGESYEQGSTQTITWTSTNFTGDVKIELTGSNPTVIAATVANTGTYTWDIPETLAVAADYKVMISDAVDGDPMGESAAAFSVTEKPFVLPALVITEIMYTSPDANGKEEWVEIYNNGTSTVDMGGFYILDNDPIHIPTPIVLPAGSMIAPGEYFTVETSDGGQPELFPFVPDYNGSGKFNFGKVDEVKLFHTNGQLIDSVSYTNVAPWPTGANGEGASLTLCDPNLDNSLPSSWAASLDEFTTLQSTTIFATPGSGCVLHTAVASRLQNGITVYPNPTSDNLYISNPANELLEITVLSSIGKPVKTLQSKLGVTTVDLSDMPKGFYVVKMYNKTLKTTQINKVVVK